MQLRSRPHRIGVLAPYTDLWEGAVPFSVRAALEETVDRAVAGLDGLVEVAARAIVGSREDGEAAGRQLAEADVDAVVVLQAMAVMPAYTLAALVPVADRPLVIWTVHDGAAVSDAFDHAGITVQGGTVGVPMLTSVLVREGRPFDLLVAPADGPDARARVGPAIRAAVAAHRLRHARIGMVGPPIDGYDCVTADADALLAQVGPALVEIDPAELRERYHAVTADRIDALRAEVAADFAVDAAITDDEHQRSLRAAAALEDLVVDHRLDAGALNCHVPEIRFGDIGIAPCFGLGRLTSMGVPWGCAGDRVTPIAMLALKLLGGAAVYHELETFDPTTDEFVVANTGEHDLAFAAPGEEKRLQRNLWFTSDPTCGACACFGPPAGPATLVGFTQVGGARPRFRFVVGEGAFTARRFPDVGTPNAAFRFDRGTAAEAWTRWCRTGVSHHSAATPGAYGDAIARMALHLGVEVQRV